MVDRFLLLVFVCCASILFAISMTGVVAEAPAASDKAASTTPAEPAKKPDGEAWFWKTTCLPDVLFDTDAQAIGAAQNAGCNTFRVTKVIVKKKVVAK